MADSLNASGVKENDRDNIESAIRHIDDISTSHPVSGRADRGRCHEADSRYRLYGECVKVM